MDITIIDKDSKLSNIQLLTWTEKQDNEDESVYPAGDRS